MSGIATQVAQSLAALAASAMLVLALLAPLLARRLALGVAAAQAACLALALLAEAWLRQSWPLAAIAAFTLVGKVVALPLALRPFGLATGAAPGRPVVRAAAAVAVAGLAVAMVAPTAGVVAATGLAVMAIGMLAAVAPGPAIGAAIGILVLENGLVLALAGMGGAPTLALATAALPAAALWLLVRPLLVGRRLWAGR